MNYLQVIIICWAYRLFLGKYGATQKESKHIGGVEVQTQAHIVILQNVL